MANVHINVVLKVRRIGLHCCRCDTTVECSGWQVYMNVTTLTAVIPPFYGPLFLAKCRETTWPWGLPCSRASQCRRPGPSTERRETCTKTDESPDKNKKRLRPGIPRNTCPATEAAKCSNTSWFGHTKIPSFSPSERAHRRLRCYRFRQSQRLVWPSISQSSSFFFRTCNTAKCQTRQDPRQ